MSGVQLTGASEGVFFDVDADGDLDHVAWTKPGTDTSLLAMDRNGNGRIDDGSELFGNATRMSDGRVAEHGFAALAELERTFGDGDGMLSAADDAYQKLLLWTDVNHSGTSEPSELETLAHALISGVSTAFRESRRVDRFGNQFKYWGRAFLRGRTATVSIPIVDVILKVDPQSSNGLTSRRPMSPIQDLIETSRRRVPGL